MKTDYFTTQTSRLISKNRATRATRATDTGKVSIDASLQRDGAVAQTKNQWATRATADQATVGPVAHVAQTKNQWATNSEPQEASNDAASSEVLPMLPMLPKKTSKVCNATTNATSPPAASTTQPFSEKELQAIRQGYAVRVWSGVLEEWLYWVRDKERRAKAIARLGVELWQVWTLAELTAIQGMDPQDLKNLHALKRQFNGSMQPGQKPERWRDAINPLQPEVAA